MDPHNKTAPRVEGLNLQNFRATSRVADVGKYLVNGCADVRRATSFAMSSHGAPTAEPLPTHNRVANVASRQATQKAPHETMQG